MRRPAFCPLFVACAVLATGCQQLFTTSLGSWAAREAPPLPASLTQADATRYAELALTNRDTKLAAALMPALNALVAENSGDPQLLAAAAATAGVATGLDDALATALNVVGLQALTSSDGLTSEQTDALAAALASVSVSEDAASIFGALATANASDLAAAGATAGTFVVAAAALLIDAAGGQEGIKKLLDAATDNDPSIDQNVQSQVKRLRDAASGQWPGDPLVQALTGLLPALSS